MAANPYSLYPTSSSRKEIDLRDEMSKLLFGADDEIAKGTVGLLRKMRRDSNGDLIKCSCVDSLTKEPDKDYYCRYCWGHGYFWDEVKIVYYRNDESFRKKEGNTQEFESDDFFLQYNEEITTDDFIVLVKLDSSGSIIEPVTRAGTWEIMNARPFRSDNGRIEFWRIRAKYNREWSVHYGVKAR